MTTPTIQRPSPKQLDLIAKLVVERDTTSQAVADSLFGEGFDLNTLTGGRDGTASQMISALFAMNGARGGTTRYTPEAGFYLADDQIVRVQVSRSGNWYAKLAVKPRSASRRTLDWDYIGKRIRLTADQRIPEAEAGKLLGYCVRCSAELTDPESIARGMGPTCAKRTEG